MPTKERVKATRKNITQPEDWWLKFEQKATEDGLTLSEWVGKQCVKGLGVGGKKGLASRPPAHRPATSNRKRKSRKKK